MRHTRPLFIVVLLLMLFCVGNSFASHIVGGEFTYKFMGSVAGGNKYEVKLAIYEDCINGDPGAIITDNPAFFAVYDALTNAYIRQDTITYISAESVPANFSNARITNYPPVCLTKKVFVINYILPETPTGYIVSYQKCCRNESIANIYAPGGAGATYACTIPGTVHNSSAIFKSYPPQVICLNNPITYDNSAVDADGDSLTYEFCNSLLCYQHTAPYPIPGPPPYDVVTWLSPIYSYDHPMTGVPAIRIDPVTGLLTGTPNRAGRYLVTVCCNEWRNGVLINTGSREYQFVVTDCSRTVLADMPQFSTEPDVYILNCTDHTVLFKNTSIGGYAYHWDFGVQETEGDTSVAFEPTYTFPDTGIYRITLHVNPGGTCPDSIIKLAKVYPTFHVGFNDTGRYCPGSPIRFADQSLVTIKPVTRWQWSFGDGETAQEKDPVHAYKEGGSYNVLLISENIKGCVDTALNRVVIDNFQPFAGNDTAIVKGESLLFNAQGGIKYLWWPQNNLSGVDIGNPLGYYPDVGRFSYNVLVESIYGCIGQASINIDVVDHASFCMPNAFTPNGDGLNDVFRPQSVGFSAIKEFRVYNRFGELVYSGDNIEMGWDGTYNHRQADIGTYYWQIIYTDRFGKEAYTKGDVTLIR